MLDELSRIIVKVIRKNIPYSSNIPFFSDSYKLNDLLDYSKQIYGERKKSFKIEIERIALSCLISKIGECTELARVCYILCKYLDAPKLGLIGYTCEMIKVDSWYHYFIIIYQTSKKHKINDLINLSPTYSDFISTLCKTEAYVIDPWVCIGSKIDKYFINLFLSKSLEIGVKFDITKKIEPFHESVSFDYPLDEYSRILDYKYEEIYDYFFNEICNEMNNLLYVRHNYQEDDFKEIYIDNDYEDGDLYLQKSINYRKSSYDAHEDFFRSSIYENDRRKYFIDKNIDYRNSIYRISNKIKITTIIFFLENLCTKCSVWSNKTSNFSKKKVFKLLIKSYSSIRISTIPTIVFEKQLAYIIAVCLLKRSRNTQYIDFTEQTKTGKGAVEILNKNIHNKCIREIIDKNWSLTYQSLYNYVGEHIPSIIRRNSYVSISEFDLNVVTDKITNPIPEWIS